MKKSYRTHSLALSLMFFFSVAAFAQRGHPIGSGVGLGGGAGAGVGSGAALGGGAATGVGTGTGLGGGSLGAGTGAGLGANAGTGRTNVGVNGATSANVNASRQSPAAVLSDTHLNSSLTSSLGKSGVSIPGGNLQTACSGFKELGNCVAAMHVAQNLNVPFSSLQSQMTGSKAVSLGKAIQNTAAAGTDAKAEAKKATKQANADIHASESASSTTTADSHM
ncbi:hypothetical protein FTW19_17960 [Terriglobus albidus]|uniref:Uncharacterized protein n=1 Tax=Terriglobus albidus TaxID=1592106 RepID=A0A5B9EGZ8_9BACT|nr:hypothetical protein [Terriglobus albidus]QEE29701.1 hypothetical protein FTW19_17960 [Terriglobus albidus]